MASRGLPEDTAILVFFEYVPARNIGHLETSVSPIEFDKMCLPTGPDFTPRFLQFQRNLRLKSRAIAAMLAACQKSFFPVSG